MRLYGWLLYSTHTRVCVGVGGGYVFGGGGVRAYAHVLFVCVCVRFDKYENVFQTVRWYSVAVK